MVRDNLSSYSPKSGPKPSMRSGICTRSSTNFSTEDSNSSSKPVIRLVPEENLLRPDHVIKRESSDSDSGSPSTSPSPPLISASLTSGNFKQSQNIPTNSSSIGSPLSGTGSTTTSKNTNQKQLLNDDTAVIKDKAAIKVALRQLASISSPKTLEGILLKCRNPNLSNLTTAITGNVPATTPPPSTSSCCGSNAVHVAGCVGSVSGNIAPKKPGTRTYDGSGSVLCGIGAGNASKPGGTRLYEVNRCPLCSRNYRSQAFLNEHMHLLKSMQLRYPCGICGKSYLRKAHLKRHMRNECIGVPPKFCCDICPSRYRRNEDLKRHLAKVHNINSVKRSTYFDKTIMPSLFYLPYT
ncbi:zinc finger protein 236-like [Condylostylus longicornis]|uniref:zinc finger protein 236-like n=1 Tax=Condylostylus longicornis TaxID=2530218 RepID=UPI00244DFFE6|nr:zinc finger protein 236-like [Condylostylus longicornis]